MAGNHAERLNSVSAATAKPNVGVLALQGAFREHVQRLSRLGVSTREVRLPEDLRGLGGLILPGGESTTMGRLMFDYGFWDALLAFHAAGGALWGTCAGAIMLAREVTGTSPNLPEQRSLGLLDITVRRNAFGRQIDSFNVPLAVAGLEGTFPATFIRAPVFERVGAGVEVLATHDERVVLVRQGRVLASAFHPELTEDTRLHELFLGMVGSAAASVPS